MVYFFLLLIFVLRFTWTTDFDDGDDKQQQSPRRRVRVHRGITRHVSPRSGPARGIRFHIYARRRFPLFFAADLKRDTKIEDY